MVYAGWLAFGGNEIVNTPRALALSRALPHVPGWFKPDGCETLADALDEDLADPTNAPWHDPSYPEVSSRFFGLRGIDILQMHDAAREAQITEGLRDGVDIGRIRRGGKEIRVRAYALAKGLDALEHGLSWLDAALSSGACGQHGEGCGGTDAEFFVECPSAWPLAEMYTEWETVSENLVTNPSFEDGTASGWTFTGHSYVSTTVQFNHQMWGGLGGRILEVYAAAASELVTATIELGPVTGGEWVGCFASLACHAASAVAVAVEFDTTDGTAEQSTEWLAAAFYDGVQPRVAFQAPTGSTGARLRLSMQSTAGTSGQRFWVDQVLAVRADTEAEALGQLGIYFDGSTDVDDPETEETVWTGTPNASTSLRRARDRYLGKLPREEYDDLLVEERRFLHEAAVISGPIIVEEDENAGIHGRLVEFTILSERPYLFGATRSRSLPTAGGTTVVQDIPYNLVKYPSAELRDTGSTVVVRQNLARNPSLEVNTNGWNSSTGYVSGSDPAPHVSGERVDTISAHGSYSWQTRLAPPADAARAGVTRINAYAEVPLDGANMAAPLSISFWGAAQSRTDASYTEVQDLYGRVQWVGPTGNIISQVEVPVPAGDYAGSVIEFPPLTPPAAADMVRVWLVASVKWRSVNGNTSQTSDVRIFMDALAVVW